MAQNPNEYGYAIDLGFQDSQKQLPQHLRLNLSSKGGLNDRDLISFAPADPHGEERGRPESSGLSEQRRLDMRLKTSVASVVYPILATILDDTNNGIAPESGNSLLGTIKRREPLTRLLDGHSHILQQLSIRGSTSEEIKLYDNIWRPRIEDLISQAITNFTQRIWGEANVPPHLYQAINSIDRGDIEYIASFLLKLITEAIPALRANIRSTIAHAVRKPLQTSGKNKNPELPKPTLDLTALDTTGFNADDLSMIDQASGHRQT